MQVLRTLNHFLRPHQSNNHRAKLLHPEAVGVLAALMVVVFLGITLIPRAFSPLGNVLGIDSSITPAEVVTLTNSRRQAVGLAPLTLNPQLSAAALAKGEDMMAKHYWAHTAPDGTQPWFFIKNSGYSYVVAGENLARDFSQTNEMVDAWLASPTHRANLLNNRYQDIGIAVMQGNLDGYETTLVVQMFGLPQVGGRTTTPNSVSSVSIEDTAPIVAPTTLASNTVSTGVVVSPVPSEQVLAGVVVPQGTLTAPPLFQPLQLLKAVFLAVIMIISFALIYDSFMVDNRQVIRLVGHNLGHVLLFAIVAYLLLSFKAGILG